MPQDPFIVSMFAVMITSFTGHHASSGVIMAKVGNVFLGVQCFFHGGCLIYNTKILTLYTSLYVFIDMIPPLTLSLFLIVHD